MATKSNKTMSKFNFKSGSIAQKIVSGIGKTLSKESLQSGLTRLVSGEYFFVGSKTEKINGNETALALWTNEQQDKVFACGGTRFAVSQGAVGREEQFTYLTNPENVGKKFRLDVQGEGADKTITFTAL